MEENLVEDTPKLDPCGDVEATKLLSQISKADSASPIASKQHARHDSWPLGTYFGHPMQADLNNEAVTILWAAGVNS